MRGVRTRWPLRERGPGARRTWRCAALRAIACAVLLTGLAGAGPRCAVAQELPAVQPVAVVTDVQGAARLLRQGRLSALAVLVPLAPGDELRLDAHASLELAYLAGPGAVYSLQGPCRCVLRAGGPGARAGDCAVQRRELADVWRSVRVSPGLVGRASVALRGAPGQRLRMRAPVGPQRGGAPGPLRWERWPANGADAGANAGVNGDGAAAGSDVYDVRVFDAAGQLLYSAQTRQTTLSLPPQATWSREEPYLWTVVATGPDGRRDEAATEFRLVGAPVEERMDALERALAQARLRASGAPGAAVQAEDVLFAMALDQAGLRDLADRRWHALARVRPAFGPIAAIRD
jgi:hypothetical protein